MKLPRKGGSFEEASRVPQGRSENTDSPGVSQTWLRTARTEVWPVHCSVGRICKARMEGLPGFCSLSTAPCPPPAKSPWPSLHILPQAGLFCPLCGRCSPSHLDTQQPPERPPGFRSYGPGGQVSVLLQILSNPEKYHKAFPGSKHSAGRTPSPLLPTAACQPRGSFFLAAKHSELIPAQRISQAAPWPSKLPLFFQLLLSLCVSAGRSRPSLTHPPAAKHSSPRVSGLYGIYPDASFPLICI